MVVAFVAMLNNHEFIIVYKNKVVNTVITTFAF